MVAANPTKGISLDRKNEKIKRITTPEELEEIKISEISGDIKKHNTTNDVHIYSNADFKSGQFHFDDIIQW